MNRPGVPLDPLPLGAGTGGPFSGDRLQELSALLGQVASRRAQSQRGVEAVIKARERALLEKKISSSTK